VTRAEERKKRRMRRKRVEKEEEEKKTCRVHMAGHITATPDLTGDVSIWGLNNTF
jgi:hypothetical protein